MIQIYHTILYQPLFNLLVFFYNTIPGQDIGLAIIALTILIKVVLFPLSLKSIKSQKALQDLQPKLEELKKKYQNQKEKLAQAMMQLYKQENVSPLSSCLPLLIQLPFLIAVYQVFMKGLETTSLDILYPFIHNPGQINLISFGLINLAKPAPFLAVLAGAAQFLQTRMMITKKPPQGMPGSKDEGMLAMMNKQMLYFMPVMTVVIGFSLPGGLTLYWFMTTVLMILQQAYFFSKKPLKTEKQS